MTIAMLLDNPAGSRELYERVLDHIDHDLPMGGILHLAGPSPNGGWRVIELWESPEDARHFLTERLAQALRAAGFEGPPPPPEFWPVLVHEAGPTGHGAAVGSTSRGGAR